MWRCVRWRNGALRSTEWRSVNNRTRGSASRAPSRSERLSCCPAFPTRRVRKPPSAPRGSRTGGVEGSTSVGRSPTPWRTAPRSRYTRRKANRLSSRSPRKAVSKTGLASRHPLQRHQDSSKMGFTDTEDPSYFQQEFPLLVVQDSVRSCNHACGADDHLLAVVVEVG